LPFTRKDLLGIRELSVEEINTILDTAGSFKEVSARAIKKVPALRGKTVINLFFEASTRTRTSFEIAAKRLSADAVNISASTSSVSKGESLIDTAQNLQAMAPDAIVIRHPSPGVPHQLSNGQCFNHQWRRQRAGLTRALLTRLRSANPGRQELHVAIIGDIMQPVALEHLLTKLGARRIAGLHATKRYDRLMKLEGSLTVLTTSISNREVTW
jgi:aspartate carbamoyltransferase catalytic subunit